MFIPRQRDLRNYTCESFCDLFMKNLNSPGMEGALLRATVTIVATVALSSLVGYLASHIVSAIYGTVLLTGAALCIYLLCNQEVSTLQGAFHGLHRRTLGHFFN